MIRAVSSSHPNRFPFGGPGLSRSALCSRLRTNGGTNAAEMNAASSVQVLAPGVLCLR